MREVLRPFFRCYDADNSGYLDYDEARVVFVDLHERPTEAELQDFFRNADTDGSGAIDFEEFVKAMLTYVLSQDGSRPRRNSVVKAVEVSSVSRSQNEVEDDEEEEMPEDLKDLSPEEQQRRLRWRAAAYTLTGTLLVLTFSDPMVSVMSEMGRRTNIPSFYIAFVLAPLASNASEVIASYNYAQKKTRKTITISLSTLIGAAVMNNTFCLGVFLALVHFKSLLWTFTAETTSILLVQIAMGVISQRRIHELWTAFLVLSLYPLSLFLVYVLENQFHWD